MGNSDIRDQVSSGGEEHTVLTDELPAVPAMQTPIPAGPAETATPAPGYGQIPDDPAAASPPRRSTLLRPLTLAAFIALVAGLAVTFVAWRGASRTPLIFEQVPYAISGGLLSVALLALGGILAVADLISRLAEQHHDQDQRLQQRVQDLRRRLLGP